jgi:8-oxo-dGTP diphosphatase
VNETHVNDFASIDWSHWRPVDFCTLVFVIHGPQVLLIRKKRGLGAGKINGPGGKLDPGETPEQCAVRETREEVGLDVSALVLAGELSFQFVDGYSTHVHVYRTQNFSGEPIETEEALPLWFDIDAIPYDEMWSDDRYWLPMLFDETPFSGRFLFDGDQLIDYTLETRRVDKMAPEE